jgi:hypothetical protein
MLHRLARVGGPTPLGPMRPHLVRPARSVRDSAVKRLDRQPAFRALADQRVEAPAEPIDLDDVARADCLESHRWQAYARARRTSPAAHRLSPTNRQRFGRSIFTPDDQGELLT